jgi:hypothetical protein
MVKVEFLCRYNKTPDAAMVKEIDGILETKRLCGDIDTFDPVAEREQLYKEYGIELYDYGPKTIDLKDVADWNLVDADHTLVTNYVGRAFVLKVPYDLFIEVYQTLMHTVVHDCTDVDSLIKARNEQ